MTRNVKSDVHENFEHALTRYNNKEKVSGKTWLGPAKVIIQVMLWMIYLSIIYAVSKKNSHPRSQSILNKLRLQVG